MNGIEDFPDSDILISSEELSWAKNTSQVSLSDKNQLNKRKLVFPSNERIDFFGFELRYVCPSVYVSTETGHTPGSLSVFVFTSSKCFFCFTGDSVYVEENIKKQIPIGAKTSYSENMLFLQRLHKLNLICLKQNIKFTIIPGHKKIG
eukprot:snap_masked-scaffold_27-processed-gene-0.11-mRNA-1 protein AED:1.00 eAED:1.00 QI:0/-1/0/0/-1/1/1/0/147